ncbi:LacI family DNA-binding transcriptional regulator [Paenibacillus campi]|uniref:LacI family DNA-binding transcriptional regulator n=1 Tax=Paenibacillus campi TaxID=3106031 RepID=UPI002AFF718B|nr:LacI family DNA-binding transcriptional regulator [Paenibacillus sp. SGZ-1009]
MASTIKDIAKIANVSHTTVSRALNNSPLIKEVTKRKIVEIARELNYIPNYNAKSLVLQRSHTIGLFFSSLSHGTSSSFFADTIRGVNSVIGIEYNLFVRGIDDYEDYGTIHPKRFDGIILMSQSDDDHAFIEHVIGQDIPLVVLNRLIPDGDFVNIVSNDREGAQHAGEYLIRQGHRRIALIEGMKGFKSAEQRRSGFLDAMQAAQLSLPDQYIVPGRYSTESGYQAMQALLQLDSPPTAVFCSNDDMAIGAMNAAFEMGLKVPDELSIVGFDDINFSMYTNPALTTVKRPIEQISAHGATKILERIERQSAGAELIFLGTELVERRSVAERVE